MGFRLFYAIFATIKNMSQSKQLEFLTSDLNTLHNHVQSLYFLAYVIAIPVRLEFFRDLASPTSQKNARSTALQR